MLSAKERFVVVTITVLFVVALLYTLVTDWHRVPGLHGTGYSRPSPGVTNPVTLYHTYCYPCHAKVDNGEWPPISMHELKQRIEGQDDPLDSMPSFKRIIDTNQITLITEYVARHSPKGS